MSDLNQHVKANQGQTLGKKSLITGTLWIERKGEAWMVQITGTEITERVTDIDPTEAAIKVVTKFIKREVKE